MELFYVFILIILSSFVCECRKSQSNYEYNSVDDNRNEHYVKKYYTDDSDLDLDEQFYSYNNYYYYYHPKYNRYNHRNYYDLHEEVQYGKENIKQEHYPPYDDSRKLSYTEADENMQENDQHKTMMINILLNGYFQGEVFDYFDNYNYHYDHGYNNGYYNGRYLEDAENYGHPGQESGEHKPEDNIRYPGDYKYEEEEQQHMPGNMGNRDSGFDRHRYQPYDTYDRYYDYNADSYGNYNYHRPYELGGRYSNYAKHSYNNKYYNETEDDIYKRHEYTLGDWYNTDYDSRYNDYWLYFKKDNKHNNHHHAYYQWDEMDPEGERRDRQDGNQESYDEQSYGNRDE
ncbi:unnamed protein product [Heterobilharzia americana]|nr:unnamed protein product [Heterobilharzia americana]